MDDDLASPPSPRSRLAGISHLVLTTSDLDRLVRFYETVFGASVVYRAARRPWKCTIEIAPGAIIRMFEVPAGSARQPDDLPLDAGSISHFALAARGKEAFLEIRALLIAGGHADESVFEGPNGFSLYALDPDGLFIEVTLERPPGWTPPFKTTAFVSPGVDSP
jgi:catechol 2,3-dioxygenase-like lactoylglutathione lyase family enzyme